MTRSPADDVMDPGDQVLDLTETPASMPPASTVASPLPIPFALPDIGEEEIEAVVATLRSGWVTSGQQMELFEAEFAARFGSGVLAVAVNSATAGLHLALESLGVGPGDEVIVPTWTFTATAEVVRYLQAKPVLVDVEPDSLHLDLDRVEDAITPRTKAIVAVHFGGRSVDMPSLSAMAARRGIALVEDAAHAFPSARHGISVGSASLSACAVFSFYANKTLTTAEGGMVTTRDAALAARMRTMRLHGIDRDVFRRHTTDHSAWAYDVVAPGFKYNMPDTAAAMGRVQLRRAEAMRQERARIAGRYSSELSDLPCRLPAAPASDEIHAWHLYVLRLVEAEPITRDQFLQLLSSAGIGCSVHYRPLHHLSYWSQQTGPARFPAADTLAQQVVSLPLHSKLTDGQVDIVIAAAREALT